MNTDTIARLLKNSGFYGVSVDPDFIYVEDPSCILRSFETFIDYVWVAIVAITGMMLFGWAISMIRGAKNDFFMNLRNLILIFGILSIAHPIINFIYGDDLFARGCKTFSIPMSQVADVLESRNSKISGADDNLTEKIDIYDSGAMY